MRERSRQQPSVPIEIQPQTGYRYASGVRRIELPADEPVALEVQLQREQPPLPDPSERMDLRWRARSATLLSCSAARHETTAALLDAICRSGARLAHCDQYVDPESGQRFQRLALELPNSGKLEAVFERRLQRLAQSWGMGFSVRRCERRPRLAVFVSQYDHCLRDLLLRQGNGELDCEIDLVVSDHPDLEPLSRQFSVDYRLLRELPTPELAAEACEGSLLEERQVDLVVLARYMQVLTADFLQRFAGRVINIHHSLLPAFVGAKPYHQARERGVKLIGATAHYATAELDQGPIIEQDVARCTHQDSVEELTLKGRDLERQVLARAVRWHLEDRVLIHGNRTVVF